VQIRNVAETFRPMTSVPIIVNTGLDKAKANAVLAKGDADLVAFGVPFLANPDLVQRLRVDAPLNTPDPRRFYGVGPRATPTIPPSKPLPPSEVPKRQLETRDDHHPSPRTPARSRRHAGDPRDTGLIRERKRQRS
jgi:tRNA-dihydrouridine synthase